MTVLSILAPWEKAVIFTILGCCFVAEFVVLAVLIRELRR